MADKLDPTNYWFSQGLGYRFQPLFKGTNPDGIFDDRVHVAEMVALLGPPLNFWNGAKSVMYSGMKKVPTIY